MIIVSIHEAIREINLRVPYLIWCIVMTMSLCLTTSSLGQSAKREGGASRSVTWTSSTAVASPILLQVEGEDRGLIFPPSVDGLPARSKDNTLYDIRYYDVKEGMNSSLVVCQLVDSRGFIWFGTYGGGLTRFDGHSYVHFTDQEGLAFNIVRTMIEDRQGRIWIGTHGGGVSVYDGSRFINYTEAGGLPEDRIRSIYEDSRGDIWIGTDSHGLVQYDGSSWYKYTTDHGLSHNEIRHTIEDRQGRLWISTSGGGLTRYDGQSFEHLTTDGGLSGAILRGLYEDDRGRMWVSTYGAGVDVIDRDRLTNYSISDGLGSDRIWSVQQDSHGDYWIATYEGGACRYDGMNFFCLNTENGLTSNLVWSIVEDEDDNLWIGTEGGGVCKYNPNSFRHITTQNGLSHNLVHTIIEDSDSMVWIGSLGGGIDLYDGDVLTHMDVPVGYRSDRIRDFMIDRNGAMWVATDDIGAYKIADGKYSKMEMLPGLVHNNVWSMTEDSTGHVWLSYSRGVVRYDGQDLTLYNADNGMNQSRQNSSFTDSQGNVWIGTIGGGVNKYDGTSFEYYNTANGLSDDIVLSITEDHQGHIWVGTFDGGINRLVGDEVTNITAQDGFIGKSVWSMTVDSNGDLWAATEKGISRIRLPLEEGNYNIRTWKEKDGLKSENTNLLYIDHNDQLWASTAEGVSILNLNTLNEDDQLPQLKLAYIEIDRTPLDYRNISDDVFSYDSVAAYYNYPISLVLPYHKDQMTFHVTDASSLSSKPLLHQYMIAGVDTEWSPPTADHTVDYNNLPFGKYSFLARASIDGDTWSDTMSYSFTIRPPWWKTIWAYIMYTIIGASLIIALVQAQVRRGKLRNQLLFEQREAERLSELDRIKTNFFSNITHEFRTPITLILEPIRQILREYPDHPITERLALAKNNSDTLLALVNQLLDLSKVDSGLMTLDNRRANVMEVIYPIFRSFLPLAEKKSLLLTMTGINAISDSQFDPSKLEIVVNNLLSNAIKFTAQGQIELNIESRDAHLIITVSDTGRGMSEEDVNRVFERFYQAESPMTKTVQGTGIGLALTKDIVELMRGEISVTSELGAGSSFRVCIPMLHTEGDHHPREAIGQIAESKAVSISDHTVVKQTVSVHHTNNKSLVLLIEDNDELRTFISSTLSSQFEVITAVDGVEGCLMAKQRIPDLIVSDVMMPGKDGYQVCSELKQDQLTAHIPIVLLTAKSSIDSKIEGWTTGADAYLTKPFHSDELVIRIEKLIAQRRQLQNMWTTMNSREIIAQEDVHSEVDREFLSNLVMYIDTNISSDSLTVESLAQGVHMSRTQLFRKVKALTNQSPTEFIRNEKLAFAHAKYKEGMTNMGVLAELVGYKDEKNFTKRWKEKYGKS